jgi:hypothetical protein
MQLLYTFSAISEVHSWEFNRRRAMDYSQGTMHPESLGILNISQLFSNALSFLNLIYFEDSCGYKRRLNLFGPLPQCRLGPAGVQLRRLLRKASSLDLRMILETLYACPMLHS